MKKYILLIILLSMVVLVSGCMESADEPSELETPDIASLTYFADGISFEYPESWITFTEDLGPDNLVLVLNPESRDEQGNIETVVAVQLTPLPSGQNLEDTFNATYVSAAENPNFVIISQRVLSINRIKAYENISQVEEEGVQKKKRDVWLEKNGIIYVIRCAALNSDFDQEQIYFDLIISTFQIK